MNDLTIMVTAAGAPFMPGLAACLHGNGERNIRIVGTDMKWDSTILQMVDCFYKVPPVNSAGYMDKIFEICGEEKVDIVMPFMSQELPAFQSQIKRFQRIGTIISVADNECVEILNNKLLFYSYLKEKGIAVPLFFPVRSLEDLENAARKLGYPQRPICVKAAQSSGSRGVRILDAQKPRADLLFKEKPGSLYISFSELKGILKEINPIPEMMAMEYLPGMEMSVDVLAEKGEILYLCGRESSIISASIPMEATLKKDETAYEICRQVTKALEIDGNADFDFKYNESGVPVLMEVNPRIAATMAVFFAGGLNFPYLRIKQLLGETMPEIEVEYGIRMKRRYLEQFAAPDGRAIWPEGFR